MPGKQIKEDQATLDSVVTILEFKKQLKSRGYAESTIAWYGRSLDLFSRYLAEHNINDLRKVNHQVILDYQEKVMSEPVAMESKALKIRPVKRLFEYLVETHKLLINPTEGIKETTRKHRKIGTVLTLDEIKRLLDQPNLSLNTHIRDRAVMEVLYTTGIRLDELINLEVYHVDLKDKVLYIRKGKGKKQRVTPLGKKAIQYLKEYLVKIRPRYARKNPKERALFLSHSGLPLTGNNVRVFLRKYRISAGIKKGVSPHTLRRTCATHLMQQGADIRYIQKLLGHRHLSTTQAYTKVMPVDLKETHSKTHPNVRDRDED
jgi:integrase/recombinase XerD